MRKLLLFFFLNFFILSNSLGQIQVYGDVDKSNFPELEFILQSRNPQILTLTDFQFIENIKGKSIKIDSFNLKNIVDTVDYSKENKCVLIMIEALHHKDRYEQVNTFFDAVKNSINKIVNEGDEVMVVAFSLRDGSTKILDNVTSIFSDNNSKIIKELDAYKIDHTAFTNEVVSDIMGALEEGIDLLVNQKNTFPKSILLLSEERKNIYGTLTANDITELAKDKDIVINTIKYNRSNYFQHREPTLSKETFGVSKVLSSSVGTSRNSNSEKVIESERAITNILVNCLKRAAGNQYTVSLTISDSIENGLSRLLTIKQVNSKYVIDLVYIAPGNWIISQFQKNILLSSGISLIILLLFIFFIWWILNVYKRKKNDREQSNRLQMQFKRKQEDELNKQKQEIILMQNKEQQRLKSEALFESKELKKEEEDKLIKQMQILGAFPILKYYDDKNSAQFEINTPLTTVGRDLKSNKICIPNSNISRNHFSIVFSNNMYNIIDNNSTNGMIINGYKLKDATLKNGDVIEIANVTITFYI